MTHIWVPKVSVLEHEFVPTTARVRGMYSIKKYKVGFQDPVQEIEPFDNLLTNIGLNYWGSSNPFIYMFVGTGTTPPAVTDTQLNVYHANTSAGAVSWDSAAIRGGAPDYWVQSQTTVTFNTGVATGNLTEVGIGWNSGGAINTGHRLFSRALIVDGTGNPVTLTVLADEYLEVTYSIRMYPPLVSTDLTETINLSGIDYTFISRALQVNFRPGVNRRSILHRGNVTLCTGTSASTPPSLAAVTANNLDNRGSTTNISSSTITYVDGSYTAAASYTASPAQGNLAYGIRGIEAYVADSLSSLGFAWQTTVSPVIPKDNTKVLAFGHKYSWARH